MNKDNAPVELHEEELDKANGGHRIGQDASRLVALDRGPLMSLEEIDDI